MMRSSSRRWNQDGWRPFHERRNQGDDTMSRKITSVLVLAIALSAASAARAGNDNQSDPTRGFPYGPEGQRVGGAAVRPADHLSTQPGGPYAYAAAGSPRPGIDDRIM